MMRKALAVLGAGAGVSAGLSKDDIIFIISIVVTVLNIIIGYLETRKKKE